MNLFSKRFCYWYKRKFYNIMFDQGPYWMALAYHKATYKQITKFLGY